MSKKPYVKTPCNMCPFRKDALKGWLGRERVEGILASEWNTSWPRYIK